jgi:hypothetical protein
VVHFPLLINVVVYSDCIPFQLTNTFSFSFQEILSETGGFLRQFLIDDKGCVFIALWGVPTATHPDNGRRALWAAAQISAKLKVR